MIQYERDNPSVTDVVSTSGIDHYFISRARRGDKGRSKGSCDKQVSNDRLRFLSSTPPGDVS